ncbi:hypothetical protein D3C84_915470 [compost metagenome]
MISLSRWLSRFTVSRLPLASIGRSSSMTIGAVIFESGVVFRSGNTCSVSDRQMSSAYAGVTESFFSSNQAVATFSNVCSVSARLASSCALRCTLGSMPCASSSRASTTFFLAFASESSGYVPSPILIRFLVTGSR